MGGKEVIPGERPVPPRRRDDAIRDAIRMQREVVDQYCRGVGKPRTIDDRAVESALWEIDRLSAMLSDAVEQDYTQLEPDSAFFHDTSMEWDHMWFVLRPEQGTRRMTAEPFLRAAQAHAEMNRVAQAATTTMCACGRIPDADARYCYGCGLPVAYTGETTKL